MNKFYAIIIGLFVVSLGTGLLIGMGLKHPAGPVDRHAWIESELSLTPAQSEKMRKIWSELVPPTATATGSATGTSSSASAATRPQDRRRVYQKERDDAIVALLSDAQKLEYEKIQEHYNAQMAKLNKEREAAFQLAVEKTKAILTDEQKVKYEEMLKKGPAGRFGREGSRNATTTRATEAI